MFAQSKLIGHRILPFYIGTQQIETEDRQAARNKDIKKKRRSKWPAIQFRQRRCTKNKQELIWIVNLSQLNNRLEIANSTTDRATVMKSAPRKHPKSYLNDVRLVRERERARVNVKNCTILWNTFTAVLFFFA